MKTTLGVIDEHGNSSDCDVLFIPRIGERLRLTFASGTERRRDHYYRVKDVVQVLDNSIDIKVGVLVEEDATQEAWLS